MLYCRSGTSNLFDVLPTPELRIRIKQIAKSTKKLTAFALQSLDVNVQMSFHLTREEK